MVPGIFLNNRVGCEKSGAKLLNVGYLNRFELLNEAVCKMIYTSYTIVLDTGNMGMMHSRMTTQLTHVNSGKIRYVMLTVN